MFIISLKENNGDAHRTYTKELRNYITGKVTQSMM
jgi:hypothetical protein